MTYCVPPSPGLAFAFLDISEDEALWRVSARGQHFFPPELLQSQFAALESPIDEPGFCDWMRTSPSEPGGSNGRMAHADYGVRMTSAGIPKLRWRIGILLGTGVLVNYFDRISLSVAGPQLQQTLGLSSTELGWLFSGFFWSYALSQIPAGMILDRWGVTRVGRWSAFLVGRGLRHHGSVQRIRGHLRGAGAAGHRRSAQFPRRIPRRRATGFARQERGVVDASSMRPRNSPT